MLTPLIVQCVQQEEAHCGPATIEMLFSFYGVCVSQADISKAAGMADVIRHAQGMRLDELNTAIEALYPKGDYVLLAQYQSSLDDIAYIVEELRLPIGVEWQGRFARSDGTQYDQGHYSVITAIDRERGRLYIADPEDHDLLTPDGVLDLDVFEDRWWEVDIVPRPGDNSTAHVIEMERLVFVLVPRERKEQLLNLGFSPPTLSMIWKYCTPLEPVD
jgi:ABC-type bacteriocin/lantibiotic exporter with double-glycine peptidase domain